MKKFAITILMCALLFPLLSMGQEVKEGPVKIGKNECTGFIATCKYSHSKIETAISQKLSDAGITNGRKRSKFYTYKDVTLPELSPNKIDIYYKVQKKGRRSKIYLVVSKGYNNYITSNNDGVISKNINNFLSQMDGIVAHNEEISRKEEEVKKMNEKVEKEKRDVERAEEKKKKNTKELNDLKQTGN